MLNKKDAACHLELSVVMETEIEIHFSQIGRNSMKESNRYNKA